MSSLIYFLSFIINIFFFILLFIDLFCNIQIDYFLLDIPDYFEYQLQKKYNNCSPSLVASLIVTFDALDGNDDGFITGKEYNDFISRDSEREAGDGTQRMKITNSVRVQELLPEDAKIGIDEFFEKRITALLDAQGKQNTCFKPMTCTLKE